LIKALVKCDGEGGKGKGTYRGRAKRTQIIKEGTEGGIVANEDVERAEG